MAFSDHKILVVDDSSFMRQLVCGTLEQEGIQTVMAEDGVQALKMCQKHDVDAIVTDINMPNMDGYTLIMELRQNQQYRHKPILVLTTETSAESHQQGKHLGATGWITKPFNSMKLLDAVHLILD
ncbi:MAG: response regulator [Pseudomonadales bacterium]|nr:response regulator [Pseudomonadales bacterium]